MNGHIELEMLATEHADALELFERTHREFFAAQVGDRGDEYFERFHQRLAGLVEENRRGTSLLCVIVGGDGDIVGRVNITDIHEPCVTELGFRVAETAQGKGIASRGVAEALDIATTHGVQSVRARAAVNNIRSRRVLERCGFREEGATEAPAGSGVAFLGYRIDLRPEPHIDPP